MMRTKTVDMIDRLVKGWNDPDRQDIIKIFGGPVFFRSRFAGNDPADGSIPAYCYFFGSKQRIKPRKNPGSDLIMDQERFHGVADRNILDLAVHGNPQRSLRIGVPVDIDMTDPV